MEKDIILMWAAFSVACISAFLIVILICRTDEELIRILTIPSIVIILSLIISVSILLAGYNPNKEESKYEQITETVYRKIK